MSKNKHSDDHDDLSRDDVLQLGLVRTQAAMAETGDRVVVVLEGRDAAGKDGAIRTIVQHLSIRNTRVVALPKPSDRERSQWYFQRYAGHLPAAGELVIFNRSWYNRGGVEVVMNFSTPEEQARFLDDAPVFEAMLVESGIRLVKFWLDIDKDTQAERLESRRSDPLKALKTSPLDAVAQEKWDSYSAARDTMLARTHSAIAPWIVVRGDHKKQARRAIIQHLLRTIAPPDVATEVDLPDPAILFPFDRAATSDGRLAR
ncbi:polyphosphate kinase 2, PA0141 family [Sphingomonas gellani]|uniref:ADP/GDP-polyphosphate phosphotransferase n=1 Tax=Sphingomonas gellani TaxID=1166340 RepID=A0A1H7YJW9_9SPHN|nr:polyphosphate kinase 2 [Sphingomonas gellani]SEM46400.1 polyphosphate kinase 2, PA0141 family [Sphingomonas gellani]